MVNDGWGMVNCSSWWFLKVHDGLWWFIVVHTVINGGYHLLICSCHVWIMTMLTVWQIPSFDEWSLRFIAVDGYPNKPIQLSYVQGGEASMGDVHQLRLSWWKRVLISIISIIVMGWNSSSKNKFLSHFVSFKCHALDTRTEKVWPINQLNCQNKCQSLSMTFGFKSIHVHKPIGAPSVHQKLLSTTVFISKHHQFSEYPGWLEFLVVELLSLTVIVCA